MKIFHSMVTLSFIKHNILSYLLLLSLALFGHPINALAAPVIISTYANNQSGTPNYSSGASTITLTEGTVTSVFIYGKVSDSEGCASITNGSGSTIKVYRTALTSSCSADNNNCYSGTLSSGNFIQSICDPPESNTLGYEKTFAIEHYAEATDAGSQYPSDTWTASVSIYDTNPENPPGTGSVVFEMASMVALDVSSSVEYGSVELGAYSSIVSANIYNKGNVPINIHVKGNTDLMCNGAGSSTIPIGNVHFSTESQFGYSTSSVLGFEDTFVTLNLAKQTNATQSSLPLYFKILMPTTGVGGTCNNTLTFTSVAM